MIEHYSSNGMDYWYDVEAVRLGRAGIGIDLDGRTEGWVEAQLAGRLK